MLHKGRNSNIELLRIIAILIIITSHAFGHGVWDLIVPIEKYNIKLWFTEFLTTLAEIGNNLFIIICGYYMIDSRLNIKRILLMILEMKFYSIIIAGIVYVSGSDLISVCGKANWKEILFPELFAYNWFGGCYLVLCVIAPLINLIIKKLTENEFAKIIVVCFIISFVLPAMGIVTFTHTGHTLEQFVFAYSCGAFIKLYANMCNDSLEIVGYKFTSKTIFWIPILSLLAFFASSLLFYFLGHIGSAGWFVYHSFFLNKIFVIIIAVSMFSCFIHKPIRENPIINQVASGIFGVYLIHDNPYVSVLIWRKILPNINWIQDNSYLGVIFAKVLIVFATCTVIELIRKVTLEKGVANLINKIMPNSNKKEHSCNS